MPATYTLEQIEDAFSKVAPKDDWKGPIRAEVSADNLALTLYAICHMTATQPTVAPCGAEYVRDDAGKYVGLTVTTYVVTAPGYRAGPAN